MATGPSPSPLPSPPLCGGEGVSANLAAIRAAIAKEAADWGRDPADIRLIAVSKTHPVAVIAAALAAGQFRFGENRVQEATYKFPGLRQDYPDLELHLIGPLQTNKAAEAIAHMDVIHSLDREKLARALAAEMQKQGRRPNLLIQVNTGVEPQKAGIAPADADDFIRLCRDDLGLPIIGLMAIPPLADHPAPHFALLGEIARRNGLKELSMGMSGDYKTAIALGATYLRIGTAVFGTRSQKTEVGSQEEKSMG